MDLDDANFALTDLPFLPIEGMAKPSSFSYGKDGLVGGVVIDGSVEMQEVHSEGMPVLFEGGWQRCTQGLLL